MNIKQSDLFTTKYQYKISGRFSTLCKVIKINSCLNILIFIFFFVSIIIKMKIRIKRILCHLRQVVSNHIQDRSSSSLKLQSL